MKTDKFFAVFGVLLSFGVNLASGGTPPDPSCGIAGKADAYVLALTWQPAFCKTVANTADKPECQVTDPAAFQARNFTLHGLWPNLSPCGITYGFCGPVKRSVLPFTRYPEIELDPELRKTLSEIMPSVAAGSGLERHEWHKHGTCSELPVNAYFSTAEAMARQFNASGMSWFMAANVGNTISVTDFFATIDRFLGAGASARAHLFCKDGLLVEIQLDLAAPVSDGVSLSMMMNATSGRGSSVFQCGETFRIEPIGTSAAPHSS